MYVVPSLEKQSKGESQMQPPTLGTYECTLCKGNMAKGCRSASKDAEGKMPIEWKSARGIAVHKPGKRRSDPASWRAIGVQDGLATIQSSAIQARVSSWSAEHLPQQQTGFRAGRGVRDALFMLHRALRQRRKQRLPTWVAFVDIVGAFDKISREALFLIMLRLGFPEHFVNVLRRVHDQTNIVFTIGGRKYGVRTKTGVRTGDSAGPDLFLLCILAVTSSMKWPEGGAPLFMDGQGDQFSLDHLCFADDFFLCFETKAALQEGLGRLTCAIRELTGMQVHFARSAAELETKGSKTVAMRCAAVGETHPYSSTDGSPLTFDIGGGETGYIGIVQQHKHLGVIVHFDLGSERAVAARLRAARGALALATAALKNKRLDCRVKGKLLISIVMNTLLCGSENWLLNASDKRCLNTFWNDACRMAVGTTRQRAYTSEYALVDIRKKLEVEDVAHYLRHRVLNWFGALARMDKADLPQRFMWSSAIRTGQEEQLLTKEEVVGSDSNSQGSQRAPGHNQGRVARVTIEGAAAPTTIKQTSLQNDATQPKKMLYAMQGAETQRSGTMKHRWSVGVCHGTTRCKRTGVSMPQGRIRFTEHPKGWLCAKHGTSPRRGSFDRHYSAPGMALVLTADASLRGRLAGGLPMVDHLTEEQKAVATAVITDRAWGGLPAATGCIALPRTVPWECPRCKKTYVRKLALAIQHAEKASCAPRRSLEKQQPVEAASAPVRVVCGKRRNLTFERRLYKLIKGETKISSAPYPRCRDCAGYSACDPCRLVEAHKLAREHPEVWHDIIYRDADGNSAASRNRRSRRTKARGTWVDPRLLRIRRPID